MLVAAQPAASASGSLHTPEGSDIDEDEQQPRKKRQKKKLIERIDKLEKERQDGIAEIKEKVRHFTAFNGKTVVEDARRKLEEALCSSVAENFNLSGKGKKKKRPFEQLTLFRLIFDAVRKSHPEAQNKEFRVALTNWFDGAKDRNGGRKKRALETKTATEPETNQEEEN